MQKPFKFRHVNEIAGAFVLALVILLVAGLAISGRMQGWFEPQRTFEVKLPREGTKGIRAGSEVHVVGSKAGTVRRVELRDRQNKRKHDIRDAEPDELHMVAILRVRSDRVAFIGDDSEAVLKNDLGGFGAPYLEITRGKNKRSPDNMHLPFKMDSDVKAGLTSAVDKVSAAIVEAVEKIGIFADKLSDPEGNLQSVLARIDNVVEEVEAGESPAGVLFKDRKAGGDLRESIANFGQATKDMELVLAEIGKLAEQVQRGEGAAGALLSDPQVERSLRATMSSIESATDEIDKTLKGVPAVLKTTNSAIAEYNEAAVVLQNALVEYQVLAEAIQRHWLIRKQVGQVEEEAPPQPSAGGSRATTTSPNSVRANPVPRRGETEDEKRGLRLPFFNRKKE